MKVTVFTDYACPFCYIGHKTLEQLAKKANDDLKIEYVFMEIHPEIPEEGCDTMKIISGTLDGFNAHIKKVGVECGLEPKLSEHISNSRKAIILRAFMSSCYPERVAEFDEQVYSAYLIDNKDIGKVEVLAEIFEKMGITETVDQALRHTMANIKFEMDRSKAQAHYIYEIPTFVAGGKSICGAVTKDDLKAFLGI